MAKPRYSWYSFSVPVGGDEGGGEPRDVLLVVIRVAQPDLPAVGVPGIRLVVPDVLRRHLQGPAGNKCPVHDAEDRLDLVVVVHRREHERRVQRGLEKPLVRIRLVARGDVEGRAGHDPDRVALRGHLADRPVVRRLRGQFHRRGDAQPQVAAEQLPVLPLLERPVLLEIRGADLDEPGLDEEDPGAVQGASPAGSVQNGVLHRDAAVGRHPQPEGGRRLDEGRRRASPSPPPP